MEQQVEEQNLFADLFFHGKVPRSANEQWFLISCEWIKHKTKPIDNSSLLSPAADGSCLELKHSGLTEGVDFVFCPSEQWNELVESFGVAEGQTIERSSVWDPSCKSFVIEINPLKLKIVDAQLVEAEKKGTGKDLLDLVGGKPLYTYREGSNCSRRAVPLQCTLKEAGIADDSTVFFSSLPLEEVSSSSSSGEEEQEPFILPKINCFYQSSSDSISLYKDSNGKMLASKNAGLRGLYNLGNTCFLNSALQAISHCTGLTEYFLSQKYRADLNFENPLGMKGQLAEPYARILFQLWNGETSPFSPLEVLMSKFNGMFCGYRQHDSQECNILGY